MAGVGMGEYSEPLEAEANQETPEIDTAQEQLLEELGQAAGAAEEEVVDAAEGAEQDETSDSDSEEAAEESDEEAKEPPKGRADKRIRGLVKAKKDLEQQLAAQAQQFESRLGEFQTRAQAAMGQQLGRLEEQNKQLQRQLELLQSKPLVEEDESQLPPIEQWRRKTKREAVAEAKAMLGGDLEQIKKQLAAREQEELRRAQVAKSESNIAFYRMKSAEVADKMLDGFDPEERKSLGSDMSELTLAFSAAYQQQPDQVAGNLKRFLDNYTRARLKAQSKKATGKVKAAQAIPSAPTAGRRPGQGNPMPSLERLKAAGFHTHIDWMAAGEPPVK